MDGHGGGLEPCLAVFDMRWNFKILRNSGHGHENVYENVHE